MSLEQIELTAPAYANAPYGPWTLALRSVEIREGQPAWRIQSESPNYKYNDVCVMTYVKYDEALKRFNELAASIDLSVTAETERKRLCSTCDKELSGDPAFPQTLPHRAFDIAYCGCKGWD